MSGRDRERERDRDRDRDRDRGERSSRTHAARLNNEYFVPKDGIDREVITADICRYLGNDALVRPGKFENPQTRQVTEGYFITAYRNLTSRMIEDLKADSERWEAERRQTASRGQPQNAMDYRTSTVHQSRQYYGPTGDVPASVSATYASPQGYGATAGPTQPQVVYDTPQYQSSTYPSQQAQGGFSAVPTQQYPQDGYYVAGANLGIDQSDRISQPTPRTLPVTNPYGSPSTYPSQQDQRYYPSPGPAPVSSQYNQPTDTFYGRAVPATGGSYDNAPPESVYDSQYQDTRAYAQQPVSSSQSSATIAAPSRRERSDRDDRDRHHRRR